MNIALAGYRLKQSTKSVPVVEIKFSLFILQHTIKSNLLDIPREGYLIYFPLNMHFCILTGVSLAHLTYFL